MTYRRSILLTSVLMTGCGRAPSIDVLGSFFPVWMLCLTVAVVLAFLVRAVLVRIDVEPHVGPLALFYPSVVIFFSCLTWLIFFR
jgi:hypothetical protein